MGWLSLFVIALGLGWIVVGQVRGTLPVSLGTALALFGGGLLGIALMLFVYAMYGACHGDYDPRSTAFACTRKAADPPQTPR